MVDSVSNWNEASKITHEVRVAEIGRVATDGSIEQGLGRGDYGGKEGGENQISIGSLLPRIQSSESSTTTIIFQRLHD